MAVTVGDDYSFILSPSFATSARFAFDITFSTSSFLSTTFFAHRCLRVMVLHRRHRLHSSSVLFHKKLELDQHRMILLVRCSRCSTWWLITSCTAQAFLWVSSWNCTQGREWYVMDCSRVGGVARGPPWWWMVKAREGGFGGQPVVCSCVIVARVYDGCY